MVGHYLADHGEYLVGKRNTNLFCVEETNMSCLLAYLLLAAVVDLILEAVAPLERPRVSSLAVQRRLWNDTLFDCRSRAFSGGERVSPAPEKGSRRRIRRAGDFEPRPVR